jgi:uncharacterized OsmC-like protein
MNADELRALQAPIKDNFRQQPEAARATLTARGRVHLNDVTCEILRVGNPPARTGLHPLTGGDGSAACAAEMLLEALVGCAGVTFAAVCTALEIPLEQAELTAEGDLDFRGTLGVSREVPVGFTDVRLHFQVQSSESDEKLAKAVSLAERFCVVAQSLRSVSADWSRT